ncbi:hypothetical protein [Ornithinibacillus sp. 179-J 7C1 HS]|uniref:hypothetical protein n=1 Tax=Ornithinibacillus sp. 179-J 7C1 HS TaxID=3142384 RepID=UPI0039A23A5E
MKFISQYSNQIQVLLFTILSAVFIIIVLEGYIINPTPSDALKDEAGAPPLVLNIDKNKSLGIIELADGFHLYALSDRFWGWTITDEVFISNVDTIITKNETFTFKNNNQIDLILITNPQKEIDYFKAHDESNNFFNFNVIKKGKKELHYVYSETPLTGNITYEGFSNENLLLYKK